MEYQKAYGLFVEEKFTEAQEIIKDVLANNSKDVLIPKFEVLLNALSREKLSERKLWNFNFNRLFLIMRKTVEAKKAKEVLEFLKME